MRRQQMATEQRGYNFEGKTLLGSLNLKPHLENGFTPHTECGSGTTIKKDVIFRNAHRMEHHFMYQRLNIIE